jgi:4-hydroxybenzoate polyprenyltransferase
VRQDRLRVGLIGLSGLLAGARAAFALGLAAFAAHLAWQIARLDIDDPDACLRLFKSNRDAGLILFAGMLADAYWRAAG